MSPNTFRFHNGGSSVRSIAYAEPNSLCAAHAGHALLRYYNSYQITDQVLSWANEMRDTPVLINTSKHWRKIENSAFPFVVIAYLPDESGATNSEEKHTLYVLSKR